MRARNFRRLLEAVLLTTLQALLPSLEGLPPDIAKELVELERMDDEKLWNVMFEGVPEDQQEELEELLHRNQAGTAFGEERDRLLVLQHEADRVMLRKARAAVLLRFRGRRVPTLAEMRREPPP
jgi:hypothetical protein